MSRENKVICKLIKFRQEGEYINLRLTKPKLTKKRVLAFKI